VSASTNNSPRVPMLDLKPQYQQIGSQIEEAVLNVLRSGSYILGQCGRKLEEEVSAICNTRHAVGCANGTDALTLALWAADVQQGDEVITTAFTFAATAEAIALRNARPVFVDIDPVTYNINPSLIEAAITPATKAIIPVHLYGQPADMEPIMAIADKHGLTVVEDNAQGIGATYKGTPTGSLGHMGCISFYPTKNLGASGDAGMVVTDDDQLAERLRKLRVHGSKVRYYHDELGVNSRLDEIQAAILLCKVPHLKTWNEQRNQVARWYNQYLKNTPCVVTPEVVLRCSHVFHQYTIRITAGTTGSMPITRDEVCSELSGRGIGSMCYYPVPMHLQPAFAHLGYHKGDLPVTESVASQVISLPMYPELQEWQVKVVCSALEEIITQRLIVVPVSTPTLSRF
jgi:dTDP-4-amino-4,6-dideoxygalactose transaminase